MVTCCLACSMGIIGSPWCESRNQTALHLLFPQDSFEGLGTQYGEAGAKSFSVNRHMSVGENDQLEEPPNR